MAAVAELFTLKTLSGVRDKFGRIKYMDVCTYDIIIMEENGTVKKTDVKSECDKPGDILSFLLILSFFCFFFKYRDAISMIQHLLVGKWRPPR